MSLKTKILIGVLVILIISAGSWWVWNLYYGCSMEHPEFCDRSCVVDSDCYPACGCDCINKKERCQDQCLWDYIPYSCKCINNTCTTAELETKLEEVTIATDKTEYGQGEEVKITITNNREKEILRPYKIYEGLGLQKYKNGQWTIVNEDAFHPRVCACGIACEKMPDTPLSSRDKLEIEWNQIIDWCEGKTMKEEKVTSGKYRFTFAFNKFEETIYSNEFTIKEKEVKNEIITLEDVKQRIKDIDWQLSLTAEDQNKKINFLISGPYFYKESIEEHTRDNMIILLAENYSIDGGQTWVKNDEGLAVLWFIENNKEKKYPFLGEKGRCDIIDYNGQETMVVFLSGTGFVQYYKTINGRKIFSGYDSTEGRYFVWCNKQNTLQMTTFGRDFDFAESIVDKYFETF